MTNLVLPERIEHRIHLIRGHKVMLDRDLADLYEVETSALNRAVKRNLSRFPKDFMFQLTKREHNSLRCQIGILDAEGLDSKEVSSRGRHPKYLPHAFTEFDDLEQKYDAQFAEVFDAIRQLMEPPPTPRKPIGFTPKTQAGIRK